MKNLNGRKTANKQINRPFQELYKFNRTATTYILMFLPPFSEKWRENSTEFLDKITVPECRQGYMKQTQDYYVKIHSASARKRGTLYKCINADIQHLR